MTYWGYNFENYATQPRYRSDSNPTVANSLEHSVGINTNVQYCTVFKTKLGFNSLLMAAEMDCIKSTLLVQK